MSTGGSSTEPEAARCEVAGKSPPSFLNRIDQFFRHLKGQQFVNMRGPIKAMLRKMGLDVRLVCNVKAHLKKVSEEKWAEDWRFLQNYHIGTILDIGANTGQFAMMIHRVCPSARIYSFEPIRDCFEDLQIALKKIPGAEAFNTALGEVNGTSVMNRSDYTPCSSMLPATELLTREYPDAAKTTRCSVQMRRLDDFFSDRKLEPDLLVKIDVEGYEPSVIRGGAATLARTLFAAVEIHFYEFYKGQPLFDNIYRMMVDLGFIYRGSAGQYASGIDHRFSYADAIFENTRMSPARSADRKDLGTKEDGYRNG